MALVNIFTSSWRTPEPLAVAALAAAAGTMPDAGHTESSGSEPEA
jgi:hypothetical protein